MFAFPICFAQSRQAISDFDELRHKWDMSVVFTRSICFYGEQIIKQCEILWARIWNWLKLFRGLHNRSRITISFLI